MSVDWVKCRSDHDYIGRPLTFSCQGVRFEVAEVLVENRTPRGFQFKVRTPGFEIFELEYDSNTDQWSVQQL